MTGPGRRAPSSLLRRFAALVGAVAFLLTSLASVAHHHHHDHDADAGVEMVVSMCDHGHHHDHYDHQYEHEDATQRGRTPCSPSAPCDDDDDPCGICLGLATSVADIVVAPVAMPLPDMAGPRAGSKPELAPVARAPERAHAPRAPPSV